MENKEARSEESSWTNRTALEQEHEQNKYLLRFHDVLSHGMDHSILSVTLERGNIIPFHSYKRLNRVLEEVTNLSTVGQVNGKGRKDRRAMILLFVIW